MDTKLGLYIVADAAIQANPNADQLAEIALLSARSAVRY
jgi:phosphotransacetylase